MPISADMRLALLELTHLLDRLVRCPREDAEPEHGEVSHFTATALLALAQARAVLDLDTEDRENIDYRPSKMLPSAGLGHAIRARGAQLNARLGNLPRGPRQ